MYQIFIILTFCLNFLMKFYKDDTHFRDYHQQTRLYLIKLYQKNNIEELNPL